VDVFRLLLLEQIELPAKLLDYFLRSHKSNINQSISLFLFCLICIVNSALNSILDLAEKGRSCMQMSKEINTEVMG